MGFQVISTCRQPVPLDDIAVDGLLAWRGDSAYASSEDCIFASHQTFGRAPIWPDSLRRKILQPAARRVDITTQVDGTLSATRIVPLLADCGNDVKVVQELMRHAKLSTTMEVYTHARMDKKRVAQRNAVDVLFARQRGLEQAART